MKRGKKFISIIAVLFFLNSMALANGLNLNSLGSKALAMGGAFVGLADDFSAIYWNPAGMVHFDRKYFGFYGVSIIPSGTFKNSLVDVKTERMNYLSGLAAYYLPVSENVVAGMGLYIPSGLGASWDGSELAPIAMDNSDIIWRSKVGIVTLAPALAYRINEKISVGVALNINYGTFNLKMHAGSEDMGVDIGQYEESMKGWGYGVALGVLFKPIEKLSIGATFRTATTVKFSGDASILLLGILTQIPESPYYNVELNTESEIERNVTWPMWIAAGAAFKPMENLTLTGDVQWTQWSKIDVMETKFLDPNWNLIMSTTGDDRRLMNWKNALQIRIGAEYKMKTVAFRAGYYMDPSPAPDSTMNILLPNYDFNVVTCGFGYALDGLHLDFSLEYLMGKERIIGAEYESAIAGTYNMKILVPNISISYKF